MSPYSVSTLIGIKNYVQVAHLSQVSFQKKHRTFILYFGSLFVLWKYQKNHAHAEDSLCQCLTLLHLLCSSTSLCVVEVKAAISSHLWNLSPHTRKIHHHSPGQETLPRALPVLVSTNDKNDQAACHKYGVTQANFHKSFHTIKFQYCPSTFRVTDD